MIETIWRKDFQNSVEKTARTKGNYQDMETGEQRMYKDIGHCFVDLRCKAMDTVLIFSVSYNSNQLS